MSGIVAAAQIMKKVDAETFNITYLWTVCSGELTLIDLHFRSMDDDPV